MSEETKIEETDEIHKYYHSFCDYMKRWYFTKEPGYDKNLKKGKRLYKFFDASKMVGYEAAQRIQRYVKTHPEIKICRADDDFFMGSILVLVPHPKMGITVFFIPQCKAQNTFFLYPNDSKELINTLVEMRKATK